MLIDTLTYRTIELPRDAALAFASHRDACRMSFGEAFEQHLSSRGAYLRWLAARLEEYPEGHLLAFSGTQCVGQLELQVPYGLTFGYVNLFYVTPPFRRQGYGRVLNERAERYFRSWEARRIELHVSSRNPGAIAFYEAVGYEVMRREGSMLRMVKDL
ncbi:MAG TPA: GNAT family N-acetyltransferase [Tepidisphaeraceae bacterium]